MKSKDQKTWKNVDYVEEILPLSVPCPPIATVPGTVVVLFIELSDSGVEALHPGLIELSMMVPLVSKVWAWVLFGSYFMTFCSFYR